MYLNVGRLIRDSYLIYRSVNFDKFLFDMTVFFDIFDLDSHLL